MIDFLHNRAQIGGWIEFFERVWKMELNIKEALEAARSTLWAIASDAGDIAFWNEGGEGYITAHLVQDALEDTLTIINYPGYIQDGEWHGQGTYVGEFKDGLRNGQGTMAYINGNKYVGEWKDGEWHGQGTYTFADGTNYVGEWKDGKYNGQGTLTYANGNKYVGEWKDGERTTAGVHIEVHCDYCGSTHILREAWSYWDANNQVQRLHPAEFDRFFCENCEQDARIKEVDISTIPPHTALSFDNAKADVGLIFAKLD